MTIRPCALAIVLALTSVCSLVHGATQLEECRSLRHHGKIAESKACFSRLVRANDPFLRAEGFWGLGDYEQANEEFKVAYKNSPASPEVRTEWGLLFFERFNGKEAADLFNEALKLDDSYAPAYLALGRVAAEGYSKKAVDFARAALSRDPKYVQAHEFLAYLALEDNNAKLASEEAQAALTLSREALDGMAVLASMEWLDGKPQSEWMAKILAVNPAYGEAYATGAHFLVINRRYQEGIVLYRKALELNGESWGARSQLGINLMRLSLDKEAKAELTRCYEAHFRDAQTINALRLLDSLKDYQTFKAGPIELMLNKKEARLLRPYVQPELERAVASYARKYKMQLPGPVRLEVYPNHEDFVVRTLGLPGQGGLLGVTFGLVVAMDSPSARPPGEFNWASTMWHELSHVYVLSATNHLVPRWFAEGLAVHEESATSPDWGDRMTPDMVAAIKNKKLLPVLELDRGFVRPEYPNQVLVSYFQAGKMCDFISQKWGNDVFIGMMHSYAARKTTAEAIVDNLHESPAAFDKEFATWLTAQTSKAVEHLEEWRNGLKEAHLSFKDGKQDDAIRQAQKIRDYYPEYIGGGSAYELLADAYIATKKLPSAIEQLERYRDLGGTNVESLKKLAKLEIETDKSDAARSTLLKLTYIYPEDEEVHRRLGGLLLQGNDASGAVREFQAALELQASDSAEAHYDLARALRAAHRNSEAKDQILIALEAAPGYKPAQQLLLQLSQE